MTLCPYCAGNGRLMGGTCHQCGGAGEVARQIEQAGCHATPRGAWVCLPQTCNRPRGMCPERMVWTLDRLDPPG